VRGRRIGKENYTFREYIMAKCLNKIYVVYIEAPLDYIPILKGKI